MAAKKKTAARFSTATSVKKKPVKVKAEKKRAAPKKTAAKSTKPKATQTKSKAAPIVTHDQIAHRAYELWLESGRPIGKDQIIWLAAERELNNRKA